jgi:hypothetical protein
MKLLLVLLLVLVLVLVLLLVRWVNGWEPPWCLLGWRVDLVSSGGGVWHIRSTPTEGNRIFLLDIHIVTR